MRKTTLMLTTIVCLIFSNASCARAMLAEPVRIASAEETQAAKQSQGFVGVEGADLNARMEAAARQARASKSPFWTAYAFDVRPGVAIDPQGGEFHGSMNTIGGIHVFTGTTRAGITAETRNLALFILRDGGSNSVTRIEVYNLDRQREYSGYPVYWAGRAGNEESLAFLRPLAERDAQSQMQERATLAIALHDDRRVSGILKEFINTSKSEKVRKSSVYWLGLTGGETEFLSTLVRNEQEKIELRRTAAHAIGASRDPAALNILQTLYTNALPKELKRAVIHAIGENENRDEAYAFVLKVAKSDPDKDARRAAVHLIGDSDREQAIDDLMSIYANDSDQDVKRHVVNALGDHKSPRAETKLIEIARTATDTELRRRAIHQLGEKDTEAMVDELMKLYSQEQTGEVKRAILHAFSEMKSPRAQAKLLEVARAQNEPADARRQAIHWLGERGESSLDELARIFESERNNDVRRQILHAISEIDSPRAEAKLFEVARKSDSPELKRQAIHRIGEKASRQSLEFLKETVNTSDADTQVQIQAVRAISEKPAEQAVPLLIQIARTHPNQQVRRAAMHQLGETGDPRALDFFREVLQK